MEAENNTLSMNPGEATEEKCKVPPAQAPYQGPCRHHASHRGIPRQALRFSLYRRGN